MKMGYLKAFWTNQSSAHTFDKKLPCSQVTQYHLVASAGVMAMNVRHNHVQLLVTDTVVQVISSEWTESCTLLEPQLINNKVNKQYLVKFFKVLSMKIQSAVEKCSSWRFHSITPNIYQDLHVTLYFNMLSQDLPCCIRTKRTLVMTKPTKQER